MTRKIFLIVAAGFIWGCIAMTVNSISGAFIFESGFPHNLATFTIGGIVFGFVVAGFLSILRTRLPFKRALPKAVLVSASIWVLLRAGGAVLSNMEPERYHMITPQTIQGFSLAVILGAILGILWDKALPAVPE